MTDRRSSSNERRIATTDRRSASSDRPSAPRDPRAGMNDRRTRPARPGARSLALRLVGAAPLAVALTVGVLPVLPASTWARPVVIGAFFVTVVIRTVVAAFGLRTGRGLPLTMAAGLALFGTGSLVLALNPGLGFPSFAEAIFGAAYLCFTGFLILDTSGRGVWTLRAALETGVIAGGIISGALFALVIPLSAKVTDGGLPLLIPLVYPFADVVLITILLTQLITGRKPRDRRSALLVGGLLALAAVDISLPFGLGAGGYAFTTLQDVVWAIALAMLAAGASRPSATTKRSGAGIGPPVAVAAALCALVVLATNSGPA